MPRLRPTTGDLLIDARLTLGLNQRELAEAIGASRRTAQRWAARQSVPGLHNYKNLARLLHPHDLELAARAALQASTSLEELGLVARPKAVAPPPPPVAPPSPPVPDAMYVVDSIVCVAAETVGLTPAEVRPMLLAAFRRTRELGLSAQAVERALQPPKVSEEEVRPVKRAKG